MKNWLFLSAVSVATLVNYATHQAGKPVARCSISGAATVPPESKIPEQAKPAADDVERYRISLEGPFQGAVNAKVNIVAFSDFR
jgi:protein-disulfide isomerase